MKQELKKVVDRLQEHINTVPSKFLKYPEGELKRKQHQINGRRRKYSDI